MTTNAPPDHTFVSRAEQRRVQAARAAPRPLTHEERLVLINKPFPTVRVYGARTAGGVGLALDDHSWHAALRWRGGRKPSLAEYER